MNAMAAMLRRHSNRGPNYVDALKPLLDAFGNERNLTIILLRWTNRLTAGSWRLSPGTIPASGSVRRGGSMTAPKE